jgi:hypothetical protein
MLSSGDSSDTHLGLPLEAPRLLIQTSGSCLKVDSAVHDGARFEPPLGAFESLQQDLLHLLVVSSAAIAPKGSWCVTVPAASILACEAADLMAQNCPGSFALPPIASTSQYEMYQRSSISLR